jgi:uncharacterized protein (DUF1800 family)
VQPDNTRTADQRVRTDADARPVTPRPLVRRDVRPPAGRTRAGDTLHLLQRATYGATPESLARVRRIGTAAWLEEQLTPATLADPLGDLVTAKFPRLQWSVAQVRATFEFGWDVMFDLGQAPLGRAAWSTRQLLEVMVDFWSNHLNVTNPFDGGWDNRHLYDRDVIRKHALGRFSDMLVASAKHPAMLRYLDNASSTKDAPNENYGRELLELHTVGVHGGYTEAMMVDSARIMTGYTVDDSTGLYRYDASRHWTGPVTVLGFTHANGAANGEAMAEQYLRYLAGHPATAQRIATKLAQRFVADQPPASLVTRLASTYLANGTAVAPVLRTLFASDEFFAAAGAKLRRPYEDVVATIRTLGIRPLPATSTTWRKGLESLYWLVGGLGMAPMAWHPPNGYPDVADAWQSAAGTLGRWNAHVHLAARWWPDDKELAHPDPRTWLPTVLPATYGGLVDALAQRLVYTGLPAASRTAVLGFMGKRGADPLKADDEWVGWRLPFVAALVLDTPVHGTR